MRRDYGWAAEGVRVHGTKPGRTWRTLTLIGAIRLGEKPRLMTHEGSVDASVFLAFIRRLRTWLRPGDVVVMDNLGAHKTRTVREAIEACGAIPIYLPTYSPELNPIELWWTDLKRALRALSIDVRDELARAVRRLRSALPVEKIASWFRFSMNQSHFN